MNEAKADPTPQASRKAILLRQEEANYTVLGDPSRMCGGCRWFCDAGEYTGGATNGAPSCQLVQFWPKPIRATGSCDRFEALTDEAFFPENELADDIAEALEDLLSDDDDEVVVESRQRKDMLASFTNWLLGRRETSVAALKTIGDRWYAIYTNAYRDKEEEGFSRKALDAYLTRVENGERDYPELWFWHLPIRSGKADFLARHNNMMLAAGTYYETPTGRAMKGYYRTTKERFTVSHGFYFPSGTKRNGVFHYVDTFEISPIPAATGAEANQYTSFIGAEQPMITPDKRQWLEKQFGKETAAKLLAEAEQQDAKAAASGTPAYKAIEVPVADTEARQQIEAISADVKALTTNVSALVEALKATAVKPDKKMDDDMTEEERKKRDAKPPVKETAAPETPAAPPAPVDVSAQIKQLADSLPSLVAQAVDARMQSYLGYAPRPTQAQETLVSPDHEHIAGLAAGNKGQKDDVTLLGEAAFGKMFGGQ